MVEEEKKRRAFDGNAILKLVAFGALFGGLFGCWLRIMDVMAGRTLFTFAVYCAFAVGGVLLGAAGSLVWGRGKPVSAVYCCTALLAAAGYQIFLMRAVGGMGAGWQQLLLDTSRDYQLYVKLLCKSCAIFVAVFGLLAGGLVMRSASSAGTAGGIARGALLILAAFLAGWWFFAAFVTSVFEIGVSLRMLAVLLGVGASFVLLSGDRLHRLSALAIFMIAVSSLFYTSRMPLEALLSRGTFGRLVHRGSGFAFGDPVEEQSTCRHTVSIYADRDYLFVFELDNRPLMFGNRFHTSRILNAYIPLLVKPDAEKVLLAGSEAGLFAPYLQRGGVEAPAYCAADPEVVELTMRQDARLCGDDCGADFSRLERGGFSSRYDLVVLTPEPAFMRGSGRFFSKATFRKAAACISEDGVVALHLDARALTREAFAAVLEEMHAIFPEMQVWCTGVYEWMVTGSMRPMKIDAQAVLDVFEREAVFRDFVRAGKISASDLLACLVCDKRGIESWLEGKEGLDGWRGVSFDSPRIVLGGGSTLMSPAHIEKVRLLSSEVWLERGELEREVFDVLVAEVDRNISARLSAVMAVAHMAGGKPEEGLKFAREAAAVNANDALLVQFCETLELEGRRRIAIGDYKGAVRCYENMLSLDEGSPQAHYGMGYCLRANGDMQNAYIHFARAVVGAPAQVHYRMEFAEVALSIGQFSTADRQYGKILELEPDNAQALLLYAKAQVYKGREDRNPEKAIELAVRACEVTAWKVPEVIIGLADMYIEAGRVMEGMGIKRRLKEEGAFRLKDGKAGVSERD